MHTTSTEQVNQQRLLPATENALLLVWTMYLQSTQSESNTVKLFHILSQQNHIQP